MEVTPSGIVMEAREEQPLKQASPREVREEGRVMETREEQLEKVLFFMVVTPVKYLNPSKDLILLF